MIMASKAAYAIAADSTCNGIRLEARIEENFLQSSDSIDHKYPYTAKPNKPNQIPECAVEKNLSF